MSTRSTPKSAQAARSSGCIRHQTMSAASSPNAATARMPSRSSAPIAGMPTSSSGTPMPSRWRAMASFSSSENATPADCSPSRKVVSLMMTRGMALLDPNVVTPSLSKRNASAQTLVVGGVCRQHHRHAAPNLCALVGFATERAPSRLTLRPDERATFARCFRIPWRAPYRAIR